MIGDDRIVLHDTRAPFGRCAQCGAPLPTPAGTGHACIIVPAWAKTARAA